MNSCTFIGHRNCSSQICNQLWQTIEKLVIEESVSVFYVGTHGNFDKFAYQVLVELEKKYEIKVFVVLAYLNGKKENIYYDTNKTIFPDVLEKTSFRYAINKRNEFMIKNSQYMICYVDNTFSNSYDYVKLALKNKLKIINIGTYKVN